MTGLVSDTPNTRYFPQLQSSLTKSNNRHPGVLTSSGSKFGCSLSGDSQRSCDLLGSAQAALRSLLGSHLQHSETVSLCMQGFSPLQR
jgi:hypothetical protein